MPPDLRSSEPLLDSARALDSGQRVAPFQAMEPGKVGIGGTEFRSVLDGQGSKVCVGCKISAGAQRQEQLAENPQVARTGMHDSRGRLIQPGSHKFKRFAHRQRAPEQAWSSGEPEECEKNIPRKS